MKKCPACNRTYSDETLSFCLEDGSLLSAPFNLHKEQETVLRPNITKPAPAEYFSPATPKYNEIPTMVSAKNSDNKLQEKPQTRSRKKMLYAFAFDVIVMVIFVLGLFALGFPIFVIFFFGILAYFFLNQIFPSSSSNGTHKIKAQSNAGLIILFGLIGFFIITALYTQSFIPMIFALGIALYYSVKLIIKKMK